MKTHLLVLWLVIIIIIVVGCKKIIGVNENNSSQANNKIDVDTIESNDTKRILLLPDDSQTVNKSPLLVIHYLNSTEKDKLNKKLKKSFDPCIEPYISPRVDNIGMLDSYWFQKANINCKSLTQLFLTKDPEKIKVWIQQILNKNNEFTAVYNESIKLNMRDRNIFPTQRQYLFETLGQEMLGYEVFSGKTPVKITGYFIFNDDSTNIEMKIEAHYFPEINITSLKPLISLDKAKEILIKEYNLDRNKVCNTKEKQKKGESQESTKAFYDQATLWCNLINESTVYSLEEEGKLPPEFKSGLRINIQEIDNNRIEYRLVWNIRLKQNCRSTAYIDAINGELVSVNDFCVY